MYITPKAIFHKNVFNIIPTYFKVLVISVLLSKINNIAYNSIDPKKR